MNVAEFPSIRPATGTAIARAECVALARAIESGNGALTPAIAKLIQHAPESFEDLRLGKIAVVVRYMRENNQAVHFESVGARSSETLFVETELANDVLSSELSEMEAESALAAYEVRRAQSVFEDAAISLRSAPTQAKSIVRAAVQTLNSLVAEANPKQRVLTLRSPDKLLAMRFDDSDIILGDRLLAKGQPLVIAAQGGTGKSRLGLQMVAAIVTGRKFLAFDTGASELRWLILQTENSNRRLQQDLARIRNWLGDDWPRFNEQVVFHTIENDDDGFVSLDSPDNQLAIQAAIESAKPDCILIDPLNDFAAGDLNKDADMKTTLQTLSRLCRRGNPQRAIVVLHHSLTGRAGAQKATGYDRSSFARNSKSLHAWTRGQINLAAVDKDNNNRLIVACGKNNNGKEFLAFGVRLNADMIYECDPSIDVTAWQSEMSGKSPSLDLSPDMVAGIVAELGKANGAPKKPQIVKELREETGCSQPGAYKAIDRAERAKKIHYTKGTKTYVIR